MEKYVLYIPQGILLHLHSFYRVQLYTHDQVVHPDTTIHSQNLRAFFDQKH